MIFFLSKKEEEHSLAERCLCFWSFPFPLSKMDLNENIVNRSNFRVMHKGDCQTDLHKECQNYLLIF